MQSAAKLILVLIVLFMSSFQRQAKAQAVISIDASKRLHSVSRLLTGACIEDVNHEIYGGIYSQMIFGESFQEPSPTSPVQGFAALGGTWTIQDDIVNAPQGPGNKLIATGHELDSGEASVDLYFEGNVAGNSGLLLNVNRAKTGADNFWGYEVSLDIGSQIVLLGRHQNDWRPLKSQPCAVPANKWIRLTARWTQGHFEILVDGVSKLAHDEPKETLLPAGTVGVRQWQRPAQFRNFQLLNKDRQPLSQGFKPDDTEERNSVSGMWRAIESDLKLSEYSLDTKQPFVGKQSQRIQLKQSEQKQSDASREICGLENRGLNRWGLFFQQGKSYNATVYVRTEAPCEFWLSAESADGKTKLAEKVLKADGSGWHRYECELTPNSTVRDGRFAISLKTPGEIWLGYVSLHPGPWGRFKNLPIRKDVADLLIDQGVTILRYGGSMVNHAEYRWKKMIGQRESRQPYQGLWYPHSTNGWGIVDFMSFCEAADFEYVPTFNMDESPQDMADFIHYCKDPVDQPWGKRRLEDGHTEPFRLKYIQLGNEERIDQSYVNKFREIANQIWSIDSEITIVVGDFVYDIPITEPQKIEGAASGITNLNGQAELLKFAKQNNREIWFDIHVWTDGPRPNRSFDAMFTYIDALEKLSEGARFKVLTFEFNSNSHDMKRGLANALAINAIMRDGRLPIATSANCLQPDGQNDNGWNQGLLFLNPSQVWLQPPGYVTQMFSRYYQPTVVSCKLEEPETQLDATATLSQDGKTVSVSIVNLSDQPSSCSIKLSGIQLQSPIAEVLELSGNSNAVNTATEPDRVIPHRRTWQHNLPAKSSSQISLEPHSVTMIRLQ
ncbi:MAG: alpha-L-arabinofuranosidase C-terminal domain-containing protein [Pirellulales bacterium]